MTNPTIQKPSGAAETPKSPTDSQSMLFKEITTRWNRFSKDDVSAMTSRDDLVTQIVAKYGLEKEQAQRDADALLKGRTF